MQQRNFGITNEHNERLACVEVLPEDHQATIPVVILCHGFAYFKEESGLFTELAELLAARGYGVYYFDFSGCGESEGDYRHTTLTKLVDDLRAVISAVAELPYADAANISLVGQSFGTSVCIASQLHDVRRMALCGSFYNPFTVISRHLDDVNFDGITETRKKSGRVVTLEKEFWDDFKNYNLELLIRDFTCPVLFVHGEQDFVVPVENARPLFENAENARLSMIANSDHGLQPNRRHAIEQIVDFLG